MKSREQAGTAYRDDLQKLFLVSVAVAYAIALVLGLVLAFPWGLIGLVALLGFGVLFIKVLAERLRNAEDDHYADNVDQ